MRKLNTILLFFLCNIFGAGGANPVQEEQDKNSLLVY